MAITVDQISSLVGRYINSVVNEQANEEFPALGEGVIKKLKKPDKVGIVNVKAGELSSAGFLADGASLLTGSSILPSQGTYLPVALFGRLSIPRVAAGLASSVEDGVDIVKEQMDSLGKTLGRQLARGFFGLSLGSPASQANSGQAVVSLNDVSGFRVGQTVSCYNGASLVESAIVQSITINAEAPHSVTMTANLGSNWLTTYVIYMYGSQVSNATMVSLADCTGSSALHGIAATGNEWSGITDSTTTTLSVTAMRSLMTTVVRRRGKKPQYVLCNRKNEERYSNQLLNNRRFMGGKMDAVGGAAFEFEGIPVFTDENISDTDLYFFNNEDVKLHVFKDFAPDFDGGGKKGMDRGAMLVSDSNLVYDVQVWGAFNTRCERRNGCARFSALAT